MVYLQSCKTRMINFTIILLFIGILPIENVFANQKHEGCQDSHKDTKDEILRSAQNDSGQEIQKDKSKVFSSEICHEHGVPESECSLCNPDMKIKSLAPDIERGYEELLKKQCEHNVSIIECDGCRHEVGGRQGR